MEKKKYDIAAYIWPSYTGDEERSRIFWPEGYGEWQTVKAMQPFYEGHKWPRKPLWGYVNEADPYVMEMEIEAAAAHGVNVFIYDWYWFDNRPFLEQCLDNGYLRARNNDKVKFYIMWANHTATTLWDKRTSEFETPIWDGAVDRKQFEIVVQRTIEKYFSHPSYYKIDGKPVYMIYDIKNLIRGLGGVYKTKEALDYFRQEAVNAGFPGLELQLNVPSDRSMAKRIDENFDGTLFDAIKYLEFDSMTHYQFCQFGYFGTYKEGLEKAKKKWEYIDENMDGVYYPNVSVGWDSSPRFKKYRNDECIDSSPENFKEGLLEAKRYIDTHEGVRAPLITINSWNEWTETSYLEPDDLNGYGFLEAIREVFLEE